ncbi:MD-2-related lipid-recognition protein-like isoform X2 [Adelges cooleyi]|uniref:MD-2-related lipid-recognition protein-like isoform X2 n=1 Tax=Adelges cooleyi TaxID=133065 RepID=UPI0021808137|nr:MD-2-related lipid-recognition protein-like isoform X2 [Adelges cooleyi]
MHFFGFLAVLGLTACVAVSAEEVTNFKMCRKTKCTISNLNIDPCPQALEDKPCEIPVGSNATIFFNYITEFSSMAPKSQIYAVMGFIDVAFPGMDSDACLYMEECPLQKSVEGFYYYNILTQSSYPKDSYTTKLKIWNGDKHASKKDECCFKFNMKLV